MIATGIKQATIAYRVRKETGEPVDINGELTSVSGRKQAIALLEGTSNPNAVLYEVQFTFLADAVIDGQPTTAYTSDCPAGYITLSPANLTITVDGVNYVNTALFEALSWNMSGVSAGSNNWIRLPYAAVPAAVKGQRVYVYGGGSVPTTGAKAIIKNAAGVVILAIQGAQPTTYPYTIDVPLDADTWAFTIANDATDGGIGTRPHANPYVATFGVRTSVTGSVFVNSTQDWELLAYPAALVVPSILGGTKDVSEIVLRTTGVQGQGAVTVRNIALGFTASTWLVVTANPNAWVLDTGVWNGLAFWKNTGIWLTT